MWQTVNLRQQITPWVLIIGLLLILLIAARRSSQEDGAGSAPQPPASMLGQPTHAAIASGPAITPTEAEGVAAAETQSVTPKARPAPTATIPITDTSRIQPVTIPAASWQDRQILGYSVQGRPIEAYRMGIGPHWFAVLGAIHGSHECNTYDLVEALIEELGRPLSEELGGVTQHQSPGDAGYLVPEDVTLFLVPVVNPDGCALDSRLNARGVDLNRNWNTPTWVSDASGPDGVIAGSGGPYPLSEPETLAISRWLQTIQAQSPSGFVRLISYHSAVPPTGLVQPAYGPDGQPDPLSQAMAETYAAASGYRYSTGWVGNYDVTGELIHWARLNGLAAMDVELPDRNAADTVPTGWPVNHIETNLAALLTLLDQVAH